MLALNPDPLRRVATVAANKTIKVDKDQIAAEAQTVRERLTKGIYKYGPAKFAFDVKSGMLRLAPATLVSRGGVTKINGYVELASLKLDSEWAVSLAGAANKDVPPVILVFAGALNRADSIAPAIDTAAIESYLTMRRMQEDVERLETLDVSGKTQPPVDTDPAPETPTGAAEPPPEPETPAEAESPNEPSPRAETESPHEALPQSAPAPSANVVPPSTEALEEAPAGPGGESDSIARVLADPANAPAAEPSAGAVEQETPAAPSADAEPDASGAVPATIAAPEQPPLLEQPSDGAASSEAQPTAAAADMVTPTHQRTLSRPRRPSPPSAPAPRPEAADSWKKGIGIFGP